jgi:hypothetical protein
MPHNNFCRPVALDDHGKSVILRVVAMHFKQLSVLASALLLSRGLVVILLFYLDKRTAGALSSIFIIAKNIY